MKSVTDKLKLFILRTQKIRETAAVQLQSWIGEAQKAARETTDPNLKREWLRLAGFLHQVLNSILKMYDQTRFNEDLQEAERLLKQLKAWQEQLEMRERELEIREQEIRRKLTTIEKAKAD